jgi:hypothetical protein
MTAKLSRRRFTTLLAASLWLVLAFLVWNVRFDYGVRMAEFRFLTARTAYLRNRGPRVEMADAMAKGIGQSAWRATLACAPCAAVGMVVALVGWQRRT